MPQSLIIGDQVNEFFIKDFSIIFFAFIDKTKKESGGMCLPCWGTAIDVSPEMNPRNKVRKDLIKMCMVKSLD
jgi:hypothetical protein